MGLAKLYRSDEGLKGLPAYQGDTFIAKQLGLREKLFHGRAVPPVLVTSPRLQ